MNRRKRLALIAIAGVLTFGSATAAEKKPEGKEGQRDVGQYVDLQPVGMPIVFKGELVNYVFVYVRINLTTSANVSKLREKEPYFRDALVRAAHRAPFTVASDLGKIDVPRLTATLTQDAVRIVGPGQIKSVVVTSQASRRRMITPRV